MTDDEKDNRIEELQAENKELRSALRKALAACERAFDEMRDARIAADTAEGHATQAITEIERAL